MSGKQNNHDSRSTPSGRKRSGKKPTHPRSRNDFRGKAHPSGFSEEGKDRQRRDRPSKDRDRRTVSRDEKPSFGKEGRTNSRFSGKRTKPYERKSYRTKPVRKMRGRQPQPAEAIPSTDEAEMRLNKYIAHSGICSRRDADELISGGKIKVNGEIVTELGTVVRTSDTVEVNGQPIKPEPFVYLLMYKPRDTITTTSDEKGRRTVMDLVEETTGQRVYPVGRLDRNTTGALLLTNDGELANRLMHPSHGIGKIYEVTADRAFSDTDLQELKKGVTLDDGVASAYFIQKDPIDPKVILLGVKEGRNHLVRRMVEAIGGEVHKLKRIKYAGLTLKGLRPGRWRSLFPDEINRVREMVKLKPLKIIRKNG